MFTGIIEQTATILRGPGPSGGPLTVTTDTQWNDLVPGESIAVNGACLTVTVFDGATITFDVVAETARVANLAAQAVGARVNLERSLQVGDRFGGHYVLGHVDCLGTVTVAPDTGPEPQMVVTFPVSFAPFLVAKGSIAINGVSLTLGKVGPDRFNVYLIPFTLGETNLGALSPGDTVNLEFDYFGKWALKQLRSDASSSTRLKETLEQAGFLAEDLWNG